VAAGWAGVFSFLQRPGLWGMCPGLHSVAYWSKRRGGGSLRLGLAIAGRGCPLYLMPPPAASRNSRYLCNRIVVYRMRCVHVYSIGCVYGWG